jgi:hypothetical protein
MYLAISERCAVEACMRSMPTASCRLFCFAASTVALEEVHERAADPSRSS